MGLELRKTIDGFENYEVTSWGRVIDKRTGKPIYQENHFKGYLRVDLINGEGRRVHKKVHRLVAEAFIPNIFGKPQVNHIDGNKKNNSITNLEWVTNAENAAKAKALREATRSK